MVVWERRQQKSGSVERETALIDSEMQCEQIAQLAPSEVAMVRMLASKRGEASGAPCW